MSYRRAVIVALALSLSGAVTALVARAAADDKADVARLTKALDLHAGMTVAEIGAGAGALSIAIARELEPGGHLFATELGTEHVEKLRRAVEQTGAHNVAIVDAAATETRLADSCCDAIFMRDVYHHFGDPAAMNASLRRALKPCGRLAVIDFTPPGKESSTPAGRSQDGQHGITPRTASAELSRAGFEILQDDESSDRNFLILARRPAVAGETPATCPSPAVR